MINSIDQNAIYLGSDGYFRQVLMIGDKSVFWRIVPGGREGFNNEEGIAVVAHAMRDWKVIPVKVPDDMPSFWVVAWYDETTEAHDFAGCVNEENALKRAVECFNGAWIWEVTPSENAQYVPFAG